MKIVITIRELIFRIHFLFHYLVFYMIDDGIMKKDLESFNVHLFKDKNKHSLAFILAKYPEYRNLFYYRIREKNYSTYFYHV